jgi:ketosteroid isomerase-like protein
MSDQIAGDRLARLEVQMAYIDLCSRYVFGVDGRERETFANCWTEDAQWNLGPVHGDHHGREAILANWEVLGAAFHEMHHGTTNHQVVEIGDGFGRGRCTAFVPGTDAGGVANMASASYDDRFVRGDDGLWRFTRRDISVHYLVPWTQPQSIDEATRAYVLAAPAL